MRPLLLVSSVLLLATSACYRPLPGVVRSFAVLQPGDPRLRSVSSRGRETIRTVLRLRPGTDSAEHAVADVHISRGPVAAHPEQLLVITSWSAPYSSTDSLIIDRRTLAPIHETLVNGADRYEYAFSLSRVIGSAKKADSTLRPINQRLDTAAFAFNELELIVEALRYAPGLDVVVPLFSEVDGSVEHDTLTVMNESGGASSTNTWKVRFADPAITTVYTVDRQSGAIQDIATRNRRTHTEYHFRAKN